MSSTYDELTASEIGQLENTDVRIGIEIKTGLIRSLFFKKKNVDLFRELRGGIPGYIGGLRIFDEFDNRWYSDQTDDFQLSAFQQSGNQISFRKQFDGAPFTIEVKLELEEDAFHWEVEAEKTTPEIADRSLRVFFHMPLIAGWHIWAPCKGGEEFVCDGMTSWEFLHLQVPWVSDREIILPMISHFDKNTDVGYSMVEPIDAKVPAAKFQFANGERCFSWGSFKKDPKYVPHLEAVNYHIGLVGQRKMKTKIMLMFHEGCWRPALGKVFERWKDFFVPPNPKMYDHEGVFSCASLDMDFDAAKKGHLKTFEVHDHFEEYGIYFNEKDKWMKNSIKESLWRYFGGIKKGKALRQTEKPMDAWGILEWIKSHSDREIVEVAAKIFRGRNDHRIRDYPENVADWSDEQVDRFLYRTRERIHEKLAELKEKEISSFLYFTYNEGFRPLVEERWPESIAKNEDGAFQANGWQMCHNMNPDPQYPFGQHLIRNAEQIIEEFPELDGFFMDCFRHYEIDFAHDDSITVVNNKPAYSINFGYDEIEKEIKKRLLEKNMCTFSNKPETIRSMRWCDGMMIEGDGDRMEEKYFWSAIAKPVIFLWSSQAQSIDENYRRAVLHGCFPRLIGTNGMTDAEIQRVDRYMPLFEQFRRRVFCFDPDPIRVPADSRAKLYTVGDDYIASVINTHVDEGDEIRYHGTPHAVFRIQRGHDVGKVGVMYPGDKEWNYVDFHFDGTFIMVPMAQYTNCVVIKLFVTEKTGKKITPKPFPGRVDLCGDPESAFEDISTL